MNFRLASAYNEILNKEPDYTTWKYREDGEHIQTLDYIFYSPDQIRVDAVLEMPTGEQIGENRLPSLSYASDHFSLVTDLRLMAGKRIWKFAAFSRIRRIEASQTKNK